MHDDRVAHLDVGDARADLVHPPGVLVARRVGQRDLRLLGPLALLDVQVGPAQPGGADPHDHVKGTVGPGLVDAVELERIVICVQPRGLHLATSCSLSQVVAELPAANGRCRRWPPGRSAPAGPRAASV